MATDSELANLDDRRILITGGVRSGKSRYAEALLADSERGQLRRALGRRLTRRPTPNGLPASPITARGGRRTGPPFETSDIAGALRSAPGALVIDCLGTWLTAVIDRLGTWEQPLASWQGTIDDHVEDLLGAWRARRGLAVAVTNEVGWGLVSPYRSGRVFTELLGLINQRMAAVSDEVIMIVAGRALRL
jgi:adenosylcobinamide kinase/adenosylcobinamide-phosphate guanylyltransferase